MAEKAEKAEKSEKPDKKSDKKGEAGEKKESAGKGGGLLTKTPVLLGGAMLIEAAVLFAGFKFLGGGPRQSSGAELAQSEGRGAGEGKEGERGDGAAVKPDKRKCVELPLVEFKAINKQSGRSFLYDVQIVVGVKVECEEKVKQTISDRGALIKDRIRTIIAQSDPEKLGGGSEPGLETLRRQVKYQLDEIVGEGMIDEVLVPRCIPYPAGF